MWRMARRHSSLENMTLEEAHAIKCMLAEREFRMVFSAAMNSVFFKVGTYLGTGARMPGYQDNGRGNIETTELTRTKTLTAGRGHPVNRETHRPRHATLLLLLF